MGLLRFAHNYRFIPLTLNPLPRVEEEIKNKSLITSLYEGGYRVAHIDKLSESLVYPVTILLRHAINPAVPSRPATAISPHSERVGIFKRSGAMRRAMVQALQVAN